MDRFTQFAMVAAHEAMEDSGLDMEQEDATRCGTDRLQRHRRHGHHGGRALQGFDQGL